MTEALAVIPVTAPPVPFPQPRPLAHFEPLVASYVQQSRAKSTLRGYRSDWRHFSAFCFTEGVDYLPAALETVCSYLSHCANSGTLKAGSIQRRVSAIAAMHTAAGFDSPTVKAAVKLTIAGIRRAIGTYQEGKAPTLTADIAAMVSTIPTGRKGIRDRALLLVGFAGAFRRSELVGLDVDDLDFGTDGVKIHIRKSKTDQEGAGQTIGVAFGGALCPVKALKGWLETSGIVSGPVFVGVTRYGYLRKERLTDQVVATTVKVCAKAAGLDPSKYAGHSLRAGLVTQAAINQVPDRVIMRQTRHKSLDMLGKYIRDANLFRENVSGRVGL